MTSPKRTTSGVRERSRIVLLVDPLVGPRLRLAEALGLAGFLVVEAGDGPSAIDKATTLWPHAIVMKVTMPRMNGLEAAQVLKTHERTAHIPIVGLATSRRRRRDARMASFDVLLPAACAPEQLVEALNRLLTAQKAREGAGR